LSDREFYRSSLVDLLLNAGWIVMIGLLVILQCFIKYDWL